MLKALILSCFVLGSAWPRTLLAADASTAGTVATRRASVLSVASELLDQAQVSYVYGGSRLGDAGACEACNACLAERHPTPNARLKACPRCTSCSLDCSHFTELVFRQAGVPYPYLDTAGMLGYSDAKLRRSYQLVDLGTDLDQARPGDLLVYDGHVVLLERLRERMPGRPPHRGDVVHATGGKDIRRPGEGIQRERFIDLEAFRGPLRRILRHVSLNDEVASTQSTTAAPRPLPKKESAAPLKRLRPVAKRNADGG